MIRSARLSPGSCHNLPLAHSPLGQRLKKILAIHVIEADFFRGDRHSSCRGK
jgi:hypothetical protein